MKFGKVSDPGKIDFTLPPDPAANAERLARYRLPAGELPTVYIGATGWSMKAWNGEWYPAGAKPADFLRYYGEQFNTIELNTTHYRIPDRETVRRWCDTVPADFRFCPKVPQTISHTNGLGAGGEALPLFLRALEAMEEKLGASFVQLPPYFGADRLPQLTAFLDRWPRLLPLAVEVRHASWFADPATTERLMSVLAERGVAAVITDVAGRRDVLHNYLTAPFTVVRFVGNGLIPSDYTRLADWAELLHRWNLPETFIFPHEPDNVLAPAAAAWLAEYLATRQLARTRGPAPLSGPEQMSLF